MIRNYGLSHYDGDPPHIEWLRAAAIIAAFGAAVAVGMAIYGLSMVVAWP